MVGWMDLMIADDCMHRFEITNFFQFLDQQMLHVILSRANQRPGFSIIATGHRYGTEQLNGPILTAIFVSTTIIII